MWPRSGLVKEVPAWRRDVRPLALKPNEIAIFGRTEAAHYDRAEPAVEAAGLKGQLLNFDDTGDEDHIALGTMHRQGLEFKAVAIVGCDQGLLPVRSVLEGFTDPVERDLLVEHERNLLYVALTRASEQVFISHASRPSDFLKGLSS
jgi:superfamily I DNA/RNA helicase